MALDKKQLRREIERARRATHKARLLELRELIQAARNKKAESILAVKNDCARARLELRQSCATRRDEARATGSAEVAQRRGQLKEERSFEKSMRRVERPRAARTTARERREEDDDAVRANLEPAMVPVFDVVRKHIKGGPRRTRTEAFLEWAEENPAEVFDLMQHDADRYLAGLLAEQERTQRELRRHKIAGVPF